MPADHLHMAPLFDGRPGLFTANTKRGLVEFFLRDPGGWVRRDSYYPGCNPLAVTSGDFNADTGKDLVSVGRGSESLTVMFANSVPGFWGFPAMALNANPGSAAIGDFDGDGDKDLMVASGGQFGLSFFKGLPAGGFEILPRDVPLDFLPGALVALNTDADPEAEVAVLDPARGAVCVVEHSPAAGFVVSTRTPTGVGPFHLTTGDVDDDGRQDLLVITREQEEVTVLFGSGDAAFPSSTSLGFTNVADWIEPLDLDGDGRLDIVATDGVNRVWTRMNLDGRTFGGGQWLNAGSGAQKMATGDLDGDQDADLVVINRTDESLTLFENNGSGSLVRRLGALALPSLPDAVFVRDIDTDGRNELLLNLNETGVLGVSYRQIDWAYSSPVTFTAGPNVVEMLVEDLNLDAVPDVLALDQSLLLGLALLNVEQILVAVEQPSLSAACREGLLEIVVAPEASGPWLLEIGRPGSYVPLAASGRAFFGSLDYERGRWYLTVDPGEVEAVPADGDTGLFLRLTSGGEQAAGTSLTLDLGDPCSKGAVLPPNGPVWSRDPWPNPFNPRGQARFSLSLPAWTEVGIYDISGRRVAVLLEENLPAGDHLVSWDGNGGGKAMASGVYVLRVRTAYGVLTSKVMLVK
jgi:hypothetical protein